MNVNEQIENDIKRISPWKDNISKDQQIEAVSGQIDSLERKFLATQKGTVNDILEEKLETFVKLPCDPRQLTKTMCSLLGLESNL